MSCGCSKRSGLFREPLAGLEPQLAPVEGALESIALDPDASLTDARFTALIGDAHAARTRIREAAYQQLHRDPYRPEMAPGILARVPKELDELNQEVVVTASIGLGFSIAHPPGHRVFSIELASGAQVDGLPGVPAGSGYVGTFDREEAVANESIDFFASGHPLVEGIFAHYEDSALGRAVRFEIKMGTEIGAGLVAIYKDGRAFEVVAIDVAGTHETGLGGGGLASPDRGPARHRRGGEGSRLAEHGAPARGATRPDAPCPCGGGDGGSAGVVCFTMKRVFRVIFGLILASFAIHLLQ